MERSKRHQIIRNLAHAALEQLGVRLSNFPHHYRFHSRTWIGSCNYDKRKDGESEAPAIGTTRQHPLEYLVRAGVARSQRAFRKVTTRDLLFLL